MEAARFGDSAWDDPLYTTSNIWIEVNYTQLMENARSLLPDIKPGSIPLAMVKVRAALAPCTVLQQGFDPSCQSWRRKTLIPYSTEVMRLT